MKCKLNIFTRHSLWLTRRVPPGWRSFLPGGSRPGYLSESDSFVFENFTMRPHMVLTGSFYVSQSTDSNKTIFFVLSSTFAYYKNTNEKLIIKLLHNTVGGMFVNQGWNLTCEMALCDKTTRSCLSSTWHNKRNRASLMCQLLCHRTQAPCHSPPPPSHQSLRVIR